VNFVLNQAYLIFMTLCCLTLHVFWQVGGKAIAMDANATAQLRNQGIASTDDRPKFMWPEVGYSLDFFLSLNFCYLLVVQISTSSCS
jgi:hypothetical protein